MDRFEITDANRPFMIQISEGSTVNWMKGLNKIPSYICKED